MAPLKSVRDLLNKRKLKRSRSLNIGEPYGFNHVIHVGIDGTNFDYSSRNAAEIINTINPMPPKNNEAYLSQSLDDIVSTTNTTKDTKDADDSNDHKSKISKSYPNIKSVYEIREIGLPYDFKHVVHVVYDKTSKKYFGLPAGWEVELDKFYRI